MIIYPMLAVTVISISVEWCRNLRVKLVKCRITAAATRIVTGQDILYHSMHNLGYTANHRDISCDTVLEFELIKLLYLTRIIA